jgi:hypothetical protein
MSFVKYIQPLIFPQDEGCYVKKSLMENFSRCENPFPPLINIENLHRSSAVNIYRAIAVVMTETPIPEVVRHLNFGRGRWMCHVGKMPCETADCLLTLLIVTVVLRSVSKTIRIIVKAVFDVENSSSILPTLIQNVWWINLPKYMFISRHQNAGENRNRKIANKLDENMADFKYLGATSNNSNLYW